MAEDVNIKFIGDAKKLSSEQQKVIKNQDKVIQRLKKSARESKKAARAAGGMNKSLASTGKAVAGIASIAKGIQLAIVQLQKFDEIRKQAFERGLAAEFSTKKLATLAITDKGKVSDKKFQQILKEVERVRSKGFSESEAAKIVFDLRSAGLEKNLDTFADLKGFVNVGEFSAALGTAQAALTKKVSGSVPELINTVFSAAAKAQADPTQVARGIAIAAQPAKKVGTSSEELAVLIAALSQKTGSAEQAATQIRALSKVGIEQGLGGKGILDIVRKVQAKNLTDQQLVKLFGRQEGFIGFGAITDSLTNIESEIVKAKSARGRTGTSESLISGFRRAASLDERVPASQRIRELKAENSILEERKNFAQKAAAQEERLRIINNSIKQKSLGGEALSRTGQDIFDLPGGSFFDTPERRQRAERIASFDVGEAASGTLDAAANIPALNLPATLARRLLDALKNLDKSTEKNTEELSRINGSGAVNP